MQSAENFSRKSKTFFILIIKKFPHENCEFINEIVVEATESKRWKNIVQLRIIIYVIISRLISLFAMLGRHAHTHINFSREFWAYHKVKLLTLLLRLTFSLFLVN